MKTLITIILIVFWLTSAHSVEASLVKVQKDGTIELKVLAAEDEVELSVPKPDSLEVKEISDLQVSGYSTVTLARDNDKINLEVSDGVETKNLDVTEWKEDVIEIEQRPQVKEVKVGVSGNSFSISQNEITALTNYPLKVDSKNAEISIETPTGDKYLSIFPADAVETLLKSGLITQIPDKKIEIVELEDSLQYRIVGQRVFSIFDLYEYSIPVTSDVSASTGEILYIDAPGWLKVINVLFS